MADKTAALRHAKVTNTEYIAGTAAADYAREDRGEMTISEATLRNRRRALEMNFGYVLFLLAASVLTIGICVSFIQMRARYTAIREETTALETRLNEMRLENDALESGIYQSVDLEKIKEAAIERLGMVYVDKSQVVKYSNDVEDYVKQYQDVPKK